MPADIVAVLMAFAPLFSPRVFEHALVLMVGAILAPGRRMVSSALRVMGRQWERHFANYHRVLSRDKWSSRAASRVLLGLLVRAFVPQGDLVIGIDPTLERRRGAKIAAKGVYHDPVRSSKAYAVKSSGLRWISMMLLVHVPWAARVWALPFLTVLAPSERWAQQRGRRHKTPTDWARQMVAQVRRWLPGRRLVFVGDNELSALAFLHFVGCRVGAALAVTRLRLNAALFAPPEARRPGQPGRPAVKGKRLPSLQQVLADPKTVWETVRLPRWYARRARRRTGQVAREVLAATGTALWWHKGLPAVPIRWVLVRDPAGHNDPQAFLCTDLSESAEQILGWYAMRWQLEVTYQQARAHLGVETQRQWSDLAILRTTPALLGLFSLVTLMAHGKWANGEMPVRQSAWYAKQAPTFSDAIACVRQEVWPWTVSGTSLLCKDMPQSAHALLQHFAQTLSYAA